MSVPAAYIGVILIWATTPLAIQWSSLDLGASLAVSSRMTLGLLVCLLLLLVFRVRMHWRGEAWKVYGASGLGLFLAMSLTYWSAQRIPSGMISVLFGLSPLLTSLFARWWLEDEPLTATKVLGILTALLGLAVIFYPAIAGHSIAIEGVLGVVLAVSIHSASAVWVKRLGRVLHPMVINVGGLTLAVPLFLLVYALSAPPPPEAISLRGGIAVLYLAVFGTAIGFLLYFYALQHLAAGVMALITLITPVIALWLGVSFNHEQISASLLLGTLCILSGVLLHQWQAGPARWLARLARQPA